MIKEMRYKFILVTFNSLFLIVITILVTIYILVSYSNQGQFQRRMEYVLKKDGASLLQTSLSTRSRENEKDKEEFIDSTFAVKLDDDENIIKVIGDFDEEYPNDMVKELVKETLLKNNRMGNAGNLKYLMGEKEYGAMIVYSDYSEQNLFLDNLFKICLAVGLLGCLIIGIFIIKLSYWVVGPAQRALEKQKNFISNASHELRTPLTIIMANVELLESQGDKNKWLHIIKFNAGRMNLLVNELLTMSRMENSVKRPEFKRFNLSKVVLNVALSMESIAYELNKKFTMHISDDISFNGESEKLKELVTILLDNAIKYSGHGGEICLTLTEKNRCPVLEVFNTGKTIPKEEAEKIFDRFYRGKSYNDKSEAGFGLGLSIADDIVKLHNGKIYFENIDGRGVKFIVKL